MFACTVPPAEDVLHDWAHPDCSVVRERAPYLPLGATRSCVHISSRAVTHSRGERVLSWGQHLCSPAKKARLALKGQAAVQHSVLCAASSQARVEDLGDERKGWETDQLRELKHVCKTVGKHSERWRVNTFGHKDRYVQMALLWAWCLLSEWWNMKYIRNKHNDF